MALMGQGAVVIWGDLGTLARPAHDHWHSHEHLPERVGIPGFRRGRRAVSADGSAPQILALYEVDSLAILGSDAYLERLNHPTPWSSRVMGEVRQLTRTLCRVVTSHGGGVGAHALTLAHAPGAQRPDVLRRWLQDELAALPSQAGFTGAHLLEREAGTALAQTEEQRVRPRPDLGADTIVLIEAYEPERLAELRATRLSDVQWLAHGAATAPAVQQWQLAHLMVPEDLPPR